MARSRSRSASARSNRRESNKGKEKFTESGFDKQNYLTLLKNQNRNEFQKNVKSTNREN
jgi:hypothetical protein